MKKASLAISSALLSIGLVGSGLAAGPRAVNAAPPAAHPRAVQPFVTINDGTPLSGPMNQFNSAPIVVGGLDEMPLGFFKLGTDENAFYPGLASRWSQSNDGSTVTVFLRPNARWSDGAPVTAQDVYTTIALDFATGTVQGAATTPGSTAQGFALGSVQIINDKEVVFHKAVGSKYNLFLHGVLELNIAPGSVFGHLLPKDIWSTINASQYTGTNAALHKKQAAAQAALTALGKKISAFTPSKDVSAGPFAITAVNPGEAIFSKNPYFYGARNIQVNQVILRNYTTNQQIWNYLIGGQIYQATSGGMSDDLVHQILHTSGNVYYSAPSYVTAQLIFNESIYPYNLTAVRQAIAYVINRNDVQHVGEPNGGSASQWTTGMIDTAAKQWLTPAQLGQLNPYSPNPAKATQLLQSAGFKKSNGHWVLPNGKPWDMTIYAVNGFNDWVEAAQVMANELSSFGISAHSSLVASYAQYLTELPDGKIPVGFWIGSLGPNPYSTFARLYGLGDGYTLVGGKLTYTPASTKGGGNWLDFPQTVPVKGYGTVNAGAVTNELNQATDQATIKSDMQKLAFTTNQYVPEITLWNYLQVGFVNDKYFTDYPLHNQQVLMTAEGDYPPVGVWMILGYVHPR